MSDKVKIVILDSSEYVEYFLRLMKDEYIPVTLNDQTKSVLEAFGIRAIGILDYLNFDTLKDVTKRAFLASDCLMSELNRENSLSYLRIFGTSDIKLMETSIGYLFKRFTVASLRLISGIESILMRHRIEEIAYLHDGEERIMCGTKKERGFLFPDDITWRIIQKWKCKEKPVLRFVRAERKPASAGLKKNVKVEYLNFIRKIRTLLSPIKKAFLNHAKKRLSYSSHKKMLLFMSPFYDFEPVLGSDGLNRDYNIFAWDADRRINQIGARDMPVGLSFKADNFRNEAFFANIDFKSLVLPLIKKFYDSKLPDIFSYWREADMLSAAHSIMLVFWGNSPHRYPHGVMREYFRLKGIPVCGMQHGGSTGSNDLGWSIFETDFNYCDYYFSYGFSIDDVELGDGMHEASIIPVGSTIIKKVYDEYRTSGAKRKKFDILFPISLSVGEFYYENEFSNPGLFKFQKKIIDVLAGSSGKKILLKFPVGKYQFNPVAFYVEKRYPGKFMVTDCMSFVTCLNEFEPKTILIEEQSTPLNEALITGSNIIVHNDKNWAGLTNTAYQLLSKRAVICDGEESFLKAVRDCLEDVVEKRELNNREFLEKYCIYKGDPIENIENAIKSLTAGKAAAKESDFVYAR